MSVGLQAVTSITTIIATATTTVVVLAGAPLAFQKLRDRPRLVVDISGQWHEIDGKNLLHTRITMTNLSTRRTDLIVEQRGTGLRISTLAAVQPTAPTNLEWETRRVFEIFPNVSWIEANGQISDEVLIDLGADSPIITLVETRIVWMPIRRRGAKFVTLVRRIMPEDALIGQANEAGSSGNSEVG
jgi:hypothetical protein